MARPRKSKEVMSELLTVRLTPEQQQLISGFVQGNTAGTISVDMVREILTRVSTVNYQVKSGELLPSDGALTIKAYFESIFSNATSGQQVYISDGSPIEKKTDDEKKPDEKSGA